MMNYSILWLLCSVLYVKQSLAQPNMTLSTIPDNQMTKNYDGLQASADVSFRHIRYCWIYFAGYTSVYFRNEEYVNIYSGFQAQYEHISNGTAIKIVVTTTRKYQSDISVSLRCYPYSGPSEELALTILIEDCPNTLPGNIKVKFDGIADYLQKGYFQCSDNDATIVDLKGNLLTSTSTVCQSDTSWENQEKVKCIHDALPQNWTLTTILNQTSWATNYSEIEAQVYVLFKYIYYCYLYFDGVQSVLFYYDGRVHMYASFHVQHEYLSNQAAITMVVTSPWKYQSDISIWLRCYPYSGSYEILFLPITIKDCPSFLPGNVKVHFVEKAEYQQSDCPTWLPTDLVVNLTGTADHQRSGDFECFDKSAELFYLPGNLLTTTSTVCQSDATWENQENVQCWKAAQVELVGNLQFTNEGTLSLQCMYINNGFPDGTSYLVFVGNEKFELDKGQTHTQTITWEDNNKDVYCQAQTPFTQHFPESGKSGIKTIEVMYAPRLLSTEEIVCEWLTDKPGICLLTFRSNPSVDGVQLLIDGVTPVLSEAENNLTSDGDEQIFHFRKQKVTSLDHGKYILELKTSTFEMVEVKFNVIVHKPTDETPYVVGLSLMGALIVISAGVIVYLVKFKPKKSKGKQKIKVSYSNTYSEGTTKQSQLPQEINTENVYANNIEDNEEIYADVI